MKKLKPNSCLQELLDYLAEFDKQEAMKQQQDSIALPLFETEPEQPSEVEPGFKPKRDRGKPRFKTGRESVCRDSTFHVGNSEE